MAVDGCMTKAPCGGPLAGPCPVDRRKGGLKRSVATEGYGIPDPGRARRTRTVAAQVRFGVLPGGPVKRANQAATASRSWSGKGSR